MPACDNVWKASSRLEMMMARWCVLLFWLLPWCGVAHALPAAPPPEGTVVLRRFDEQRLEELRRDPAYHYERDLRRAPTPWERFKEWLSNWLDRLLGSRAGGFVVENLIYIIVIITLIFAIVILSRGGLQRVFHGAPRTLAEVVTVEEDIRGMDLRAMLLEAERAGDLRMAIRLHYLLVLRALVERGSLVWGPDRTDHDYAAQLKDPAQRAEFQRVARIFQWVWYGDARMDAARYAAVRAPFIRFERQSAA